MLDSNEWGQRLQDALLDNAAMRDGLTDSEAQPLLDWGLALAVRVTTGLEQRSKAEAEVRYEELYAALPKLLTRISWLTLHRAAKGPDWATRTLEQLNEFNRALHGDSAPQIPALLMTSYASAADGMARPDFIKALMDHLSPVAADSATLAAPPPVDSASLPPSPPDPKSLFSF
jgi:hypothetical protein